MGQSLWWTITKVWWLLMCVINLAQAGLAIWGVWYLTSHLMGWPAPPMPH
jgi:hypothetical protein